jgi:dihydroorotase
MPLECDLLIRTRRIVCPATGLDGPGAVGVLGGRIAAVGGSVAGSARDEIDLGDAMLLPGLVDLHAHPARSGSKYGVDPDREFLPHGATTVLSQGDAGANNWREFFETTVTQSRTRVRLAMNLSARGESMPGGALDDLADADVDACVAAIREAGDWVWGISVNASEACCGHTDPREVLSRALTAAHETGRPLLYGMRRSTDWPFDDQLRQLRSGDVVTYCFRREPCGIVADDRVHPAVIDARRRGVLFDVGHGFESFDFAAAETAIGSGFLPDTISSDQYKRHVGLVPPHHLLRTMAKLRAAGMTEPDVFAAVTSRPAAVLGLNGEVATLSAGACADLTALEWAPQPTPLVDACGGQRSGGCWNPILTIRAGRIVAQRLPRTSRHV